MSSFLTSGNLPDTSGFITSGALEDYVTSGETASLDFSTLAGYFEEDPQAAAGTLAFDFDTQKIKIGTSVTDSGS